MGTTSIETAELLSKRLAKDGILHQVLNAKQHEREAQVIAQAGRPGTVTIATTLAGRGTDIVLGGNVEKQVEHVRAEEGLADEEKESRIATLRGEWQQLHDTVVEAGGLHIIGTERHESRRIDNQLRGRSGRQGDPGSSRFYLSLEDTLMRIFGDPERTKSMLKTVGMKEGEVIESRMLTRQIERAQRKVESHNFDARKNLLEYDDVANDQRKVIYQQRTEIMQADDMADVIRGLRAEVVDGIVGGFVPPQSVEEQWDLEGLEKEVEKDFGIPMELRSWVAEDTGRDHEAITTHVLEAIEGAYEAKVEHVGAPIMRHLEKAVMLQQLDGHWREHLAAMDYLRQGIYLRAYAQKNPKQEYKREAFDMFSAMLESIKQDVVSTLSRLQLQAEPVLAPPEPREREFQFRHEEFHGFDDPPEQQPAGATATAQREVEQHQPFIRDQRKVGRNEPCPCGSGKKYKHCCGKAA